MLQLQLRVNQSDSDPDVLLLEDVTPAYSTTNPGGYGPPNINRSQVEFVLFVLTTPAGRCYITPPIAWQAGVYPLRASTFEWLDAGWPFSATCEEELQILKAYEDGQYDLTYELYGRAGIATQTGTFHLEIPPLYGDQTVWVKKNGGWVNITGAGALNAAGFWEWAVFDVTDRYTTYEVRQYAGIGGYDACRTGPVESVFGPSPTQPTRISDRAEFITAVTERVLLTGRIARRLALASKRLLTGTKPRPLAGLLRPNGEDTLLALYTARELLNAIQHGGDASSQATGEAVADVVQRVGHLETQTDRPTYYLR